MSSSETIEDKADRIIESRGVTLDADLPDGSPVWAVRGDTGEYRVTLDAAGTTLCPCEAHGLCSHGLAAAAAANQQRTAEVGSPKWPDEPEPIDVEVADSDEVIVANDVSPPPAAELATRNSGEVGIDQAMTWKTVTAIADTEFVPKALRGRPAAVLGAIFLGREYGLEPMESLRSIDIIDGSRRF